MGFKPLNDRILVQRNTDEQKTVGGLIIPGKGVIMNEGTVQEIGPEVKILKSGDSITFNPNAGNKILISGIEYLIMRESDVFGIHTTSN